MTADVRPVVCFVCTGNAARSVMARRMFAELAPGYRATSAGTLVLEGHPMSSRTRSALRDHGFYYLECRGNTRQQCAAIEKFQSSEQDRQKSLERLGNTENMKRFLKAR